MNIDEKILNYKEDLDYFEDKMDKYKYFWGIINKLVLNMVIYRRLRY